MTKLLLLIYLLFQTPAFAYDTALVDDYYKKCQAFSNKCDSYHFYVVNCIDYANDPGDKKWGCACALRKQLERDYQALRHHPGNMSDYEKE